MKNKLQEYALVAEIISAIAIVVSLIFVGIEVNRNTEIAKASTYQSMIELSHDSITTLATNRELYELLLLSQSDQEQLDPVDRARIGTWTRGSWRAKENAFIQNFRGVIGESEWSGYRAFMCTGTLDSSWERHKIHLSPDFVSFIESCMERDY